MLYVSCFKISKNFNSKTKLKALTLFVPNFLAFYPPSPQTTGSKIKKEV